MTEVSPSISCCFCCTSKTGGRIIGAIQAVFGALTIVSGVVGLLAHYDDYNWDHKRQRYDREFEAWQCYFLMVYGLIEIGCSALLLRGINQEKLHLIKVWLWVQTIHFVLDLKAFIYLIYQLSRNDYPISYSGELLIIFFASIITGVAFYSLLVVCSYYSMKVRQGTQDSVAYTRELKI